MNRRKPIFSVLLVDDEPSVISSLKRVFLDDNYDIKSAQNGQDALGLLGKAKFDAALVDLKMPGMDGLTLIKEIKNICPEIMIIMLTGHGGVQEAVEAIKLGAEDFFEKTISPEVLRKKVAQIHSIWQLEQENRQLREQVTSEFRFEALMGESPPIIRLKDMIARIAPTDTSILIQGESGTGKELVAQAIHHHSARKSGIFMPVDCAAINETVMESELFGHTKGAFTGADQATLGLIRSADKGTLFLDEVGELSMNMQAKLLRTIQERTVRPVGSTKIIPVDIRIVAATNRNLVDAVADGSFRQDLYYRLSAVTLHAPPLQERGDDILQLAKHFIKMLAQEGLASKEISDAAMVILRGYGWPGNVRELENVIRGAMAFAGTDTIGPADLSSISSSPPAQPGTLPSTAASMSDYEAEAIRNALEQASGNRRNAAKVLGISEATLYRRIKQYNL